MTIMVMMKPDRRAVSVSALKASLSRYLRRVKAGEEVIVMERDRPVARLVPLAGGAPPTERLRALEREGRIRLGTGRLPEDFWRLPRPHDAKGAVGEALREEREQSR